MWLSRLACVTCLFICSLESAELLLPDDMLNEIIMQAEHPEDLGKMIQSLGITSKAFSNFIEENIERIITRCAQKLSIHPIVCALYIGTKKAIAFCDIESGKLTKPQLSKVLENALKYYNASQSSLYILKKLISMGARFKESFSGPFQDGILTRNHNGEKRLELYTTQEPRKLMSQWGINGCSVPLAGTPWIYTIKDDRSIVVIGTISKSDTSNYDLFMQTIDPEGKTCSEAKIIKTVSYEILPSYLHLQENTSNIIIALYDRRKKMREVTLFLIDPNGKIVSEDTFSFRRQSPRMGK